MLSGLASARRSIFASDEARNRFLAGFVKGTAHVMESLGEALSSAEDLHHQFCLLMWHLNENFQFQEMMVLESYDAWIRLFAALSVKSFGSFSFSNNSAHYVLAFWARLAREVQALTDQPKGAVIISKHPEIFSYTDTIISSAFQAYLSARLEAVPVAVQRGSLGELFEETDLVDQLKHVPRLARFNVSFETRFLVFLASW